MKTPSSTARRSHRARGSRKVLNISDTSSKTYDANIAQYDLDVDSNLGYYNDAFAYLSTLFGVPSSTPTHQPTVAPAPTYSPAAYAASKSKSDPDLFTWDEVMKLPDKDLWYCNYLLAHVSQV